MAVEDDGDRIGPIDQPDGQAGIVRQHRADTYEDRIVFSPQLMGHQKRFVRTDVQRRAAPGSNAAIKALGKTQGDLGTVGDE